MISTKVEGLKPNNYLPGGFGLDFGQNTKPQLFDGNVYSFLPVVDQSKKGSREDRMRMLSKSLGLIGTNRGFN